MVILVFDKIFILYFLGKNVIFGSCCLSFGVWDLLVCVGLIWVNCLFFGEDDEVFYLV